MKRFSLASPFSAPSSVILSHGAIVILFVLGSHVAHELHSQFLHFLQVLRLLRPEHQTHVVIRHLGNEERNEAEMKQF